MHFFVSEPLIHSFKMDSYYINDWAVDVCVVARVSSKKQKRRCFVCNQEDHVAKACLSRVVRPKEASCFRCGEPGHVVFQCSSQIPKDV